MGCEAQSLDPAAIPEIAIRLADEGVPLRAIARAIKISSDTLRERLKLAQTSGRLLDLPRDDWPPGFPRDQRALQLARLEDTNREALFQAVQMLFKLTRTETGLLLTLLQKNLPKDRYDMAIGTIDVHIHRIRKRLIPYGIDIETLWGYGYRFSPEDRHRIMDLILASVPCAVPA